MSVTIGMPSLKLNNVGRVGKHSGSFKKVAEEALAERRGRDTDIDNSLTHENEIEGFKTAAELLEYSEKHIAELNAEIDKKNAVLSEINKERKAQGLKPVAKIKHIRKDTVAMVSTIFKPPFEFMETLSQEQQRKFLKDCREIFGGIVGEENIKSTAYHWDEICGHVHVFWEPMTKDGRLCAKDMHNIKFFNTVNRKVPQELRKRGWDIADCKMYDAAEEEEKMVLSRSQLHTKTLVWKSA